MNTFAVILVAGGKSSRFQSDRHGFDGALVSKKPFVDLGGMAVWLHSARKFARRTDIKQLILVVPRGDREEVERRYAGDISFMSINVVEGGVERTDSVAIALKLVRDEIDYVAIHDAVRPCVSEELVENVFAAAIKYGAAIPASPVVDTLKKAASGTAPGKTELETLQAKFGFRSEVENDADRPTGKTKHRAFVETTVSREGLWEAQTPQVFQRQLIADAYKTRAGNSSDDCALVERTGARIALVPSNRLNIKITTQADLVLASLILRGKMETRV